MPLLKQSKTVAILIAAVTIFTVEACKTGKVLSVAPATFSTGEGYAQEPLPYAYAALEPFIDAQTMELHYVKHHSGYIKKLNEVKFSHPDMMGKSLEELLQNVSKLPADVREVVRNNGGGHWNHAFFWKIMTPATGQQPTGTLLEAINAKWGSVDAFKSEFEKAGLTHFGSGWVWLVKTADGLAITTTTNQDNPLMDIAKVRGVPVLAIDLWEHAYYLHYQNKRADYLKNFWNVVNWERAQTLFNVS